MQEVPRRRKKTSDRKHQEKSQNALGPDQSIAKGAAVINAEVGETHSTTRREKNRILKTIELITDENQSQRIVKAIQLIEEENESRVFKTIKLVEDRSTSGNTQGVEKGKGCSRGRNKKK